MLVHGTRCLHVELPCAQEAQHVVVCVERAALRKRVAKLPERGLLLLRQVTLSHVTGRPE